MTPSASSVAPELTRPDHLLRPLPTSPIRVAVHSSDPLVRIGVNAGLRALPAVEIVDALADAQVVIVSASPVVTDEVPPAARLVRLSEDLCDPEATPHGLLEAITSAHHSRPRHGLCRYTTSPHTAGPVSAAVISEREAEILRLLADGLETPEIAARMAYADRTVKNILHNLLSRLELHNRAHAVAYALRHGLI